MPKPQAEPMTGPQAPQTAHEPAPTCQSCAVFQDNPYTHYPELDGWCWAEMEGTRAQAPVCSDYLAGAVKDLRNRQVIDPRPQTPAERILH